MPNIQPLKYLFALTVVVFSWSALAFDQSHADWTSVLKKYQNSAGLLNYARLKAEKPPEFAAYLKSLESVAVGEFNVWSDNQKKAFLINAYNAFTVKLIVDNYPVASIKKIGSFFTKPWSVRFFSLFGGQVQALDPIEHEWLRPKFKDYRIHAAVNCASLSCPPLRSEAYVAARLDAQLDEQMRVWLADPSRNQLDAAAKVYKISKIFDWYKSDFEAWGGGVLNAINKFTRVPVDAATLAQIKIEYLTYNWDLNEAK